jgi:hypothetical protein
MLQSHRDTVRFVFSNLQPIKGNTVFHELGGVARESIYTTPHVESYIWALASTNRSMLSITQSDHGIPAGVDLDAWGKRKTVTDKSLGHGMFTFNVPVDYWKESIDNIEQTIFTYATSVNGELNLTSSGVENQVVVLDTFRNFRYQPNRGYLYSVSMFLPNPSNAGQRDFGAFTEEAGIFYRLRGTGTSWSLYAVSRTTIDGVTVDTETDITDDLPDDYNPEKGNIYDIQAQMRMVGNFNFYIGSTIVGLPALVKKVKNLNIVNNITIFNPSMPISFSCINQGDDVLMRCGCVDLSSEGGIVDTGVYGSVSIDNLAGQVSITGYNVPIIVVKNRSTVPVTGRRNTRDILRLVTTGYADNRCLLRIWSTRDETAITLNDQVFKPYGDGLIEYIEYNNPVVITPMTFDTTKAKLIFGIRVAQDQSQPVLSLFDGRADIFQTPGEILIFTMHRENGIGAVVGVTYEFAEEI